MYISFVGVSGPNNVQSFHAVRIQWYYVLFCMPASIFPYLHSPC